MTQSLFDTRRGNELLTEAGAYYAAMARFRRERQRNKRYNYGDQWGDTVNINGRSMTEEQYIKEQGNIPLKNNLIRRLVRNVIGVYSSQHTEPVCIARDRDEQASAKTLTTLLQYNMQTNRLSALYARSIEEFLISGLVVHRKTYSRRGGRTECWTDYVHPNSFFVDNRMRDFRGWDCTCIGQVHDVSLESLLREFARDEVTASVIEDIYRPAYSAAAGGEFGRAGTSDNDFLCPRDRSMCRVIEIWRREIQTVYTCHDSATGSLYRTRRRSQVRGNPRRTGREVWRYYYVAPTGHILAEGDTPYGHGSHPYVMKAYPMIDGEIHSFVNDVIDQQRYTNRLITLYDWVMRAGAKGVLLVPEDCIPRGVSPRDFADTWSRHNGVLIYRPSSHGSVPQQIVANSTNIGIRELLDLQLNFFQDISGVNNALLGKTGNAAISAELYSQQTQNATTTLLDVLDTFSEFVRDAAYKDVKNIQQFYDRDRIVGIAGADAVVDISDVEVDLSISPSTSTPGYRQASNEMLMEIWRSGQITLEQLLRAGHFPFADALLSDPAVTQQAESGR